MTEKEGIGRKYITPFKENLKKTCEWFKVNYPNIRGI